MVSYYKLRDCFKYAENAFTDLFDLKCDIYEFSEFRNPVSGICEKSLNVIISKVPCKLSFENSPHAHKNIDAATIKQIVTIYTSPDVIVKPGSVIRVFKDDAFVDYCFSGVARTYRSHCEFEAVLSKNNP